MMKNFLFAFFIFVLATFMRFAYIEVSPGYEWDEPVYAAISERVLEIGYPNLKGEGGVFTTEPYLYHPPFDFYLKAYWFKLFKSSDIIAGRMLSAIEGLISIVFVFLFLKEMMGIRIAFIGFLFLATDGWLIYTHRLNLIETGMMVWGVLGIWFYSKAVKTEKTRWYVLGGFFLAFAAIYKHTGIPFLFVPIINFLLNPKSREDWKNHIIIINIMTVVVLVYLVFMLDLWNGIYKFQTWVQMTRALGEIGSRGLNYGIEDMLHAIMRTYWVFFITILTIFVVGVLIIVRIIEAVFKKHQLHNSVFLSWTIASFIFLAGIALKAPHYLIIVLFPAYIFIASELGQLNGRIRIKKIFNIIIVLVLGFNFLTWNMRFMQYYDNPLLETFKYFENISLSARVLADDCVGTGISQPYYNLDRNLGSTSLELADPNYIVIYSSVTQKPPESEALQNLLASSNLEKQYRGFKEVIEIYKTDS